MRRDLISNYSEELLTLRTLSDIVHQPPAGGIQRSPLLRSVPPFEGLHIRIQITERTGEHLNPASEAIMNLSFIRLPFHWFNFEDLSFITNYFVHISERFH